MILRVTAANVSTAYWKAERFVLHFPYLLTQGDPIAIWSNLDGSVNSPIAIYTFIGGQDLDVDMTDYLRSSGAATLYWSTLDGDEWSPALTISVTYAGLINPAGVIIPPHPFANDTNCGMIIPPRVFYCKERDDVQAELYKTGNWSVIGDASLASDGRHVGLIEGIFTLSNGTRSLVYKPRKMDCGIRYVRVTWVSFTGRVRSHWFECAKVKQSVKDAFSLVIPDNGYSETKGREDGFVLRLDGLDAYDLWYYADVIFSSDVKISFDNNTFYTAQVTDKTITLPDGEAGTDGKLEININYRKYDAVAM